MILRRIAIVTGFALVTLSSPVAALGGIALWQQHAPDSFRHAVLAVSEWTEPGGSTDAPAGLPGGRSGGRSDGRIEVAVDTTAANPG